MMKNKNPAEFFKHPNFGLKFRKFSENVFPQSFLSYRKELKYSYLQT